MELDKNGVLKVRNILICDFYNTSVLCAPTSKQRDCTISERLQKAKYKCLTPNSHYCFGAKLDCMTCETIQY